MSRLEQGLIQMYIGEGKGKTTAALGLAFRALGHGLSVVMISFLKGGGYSGELQTAARLAPDFQILQFGRGCPQSETIRSGTSQCTGCGQCFVYLEGVLPEDREDAAAAWSAACAALEGTADLVILDEIGGALSMGLLDPETVCGTIGGRPSHQEVVLTGREMPTCLLDLADLITEMVQRRHPWMKGIASRRGIEY